MATTIALIEIMPGSKSISPLLVLTITTILIIVGGGAYYLHDRQQERMDLLEKYYTLPLAVLTDEAVSVPSPYQQGITAFRAGDFAYAAELFALVGAGAREDHASDFFLGHCHYQMGKYRDAYDAFARIADQVHPWTEDAQWHQILSGYARSGYLDGEDVDLLNEIAVDPSHFYQPLALSFLQEVD